MIIVDRIENGIAVCECDGSIVVIALSEITGKVREGDILCAKENGVGYAIDSVATSTRRNVIQDRFDRIKTRRRE